MFVDAFRNAFLRAIFYGFPWDNNERPAVHEQLFRYVPSAGRHLIAFDEIRVER